MYSSFVFYLREDGQMIGRNMQEVVVNNLWFRYACVHLLLLLHRVAECITYSSVYPQIRAFVS